MVYIDGCLKLSIYGIKREIGNKAIKNLIETHPVKERWDQTRPFD